MDRNAERSRILSYLPTKLRACLDKFSWIRDESENLNNVSTKSIPPFAVRERLRFDRSSCRACYQGVQWLLLPRHSEGIQKSFKGLWRTCARVRNKHTCPVQGVCVFLRPSAYGRLQL